MERQILHLVIPAFPIALARVANAGLRNRPVAVAPENSERALIQTVSAEAAAEGVFPGTPLFRARRICPTLTVIPPDPLAAAKGTRVLAELSSRFTPVVEPAAGRMFLDLTGSGRLFGPPRDVAARLEREIARDLGLGAMAGTGVNKLVSRIAADVLPEPGVYDVFRGSERTFLAPFPVTVIPGIGNGREAGLLRDLNLVTVAQVAELNVAQLRLAVGPFAPLLHERARGIDRSPVEIPKRITAIVEEAFLEREDNSDAVILAELCRLVEGCGLKLRRQGKQTCTLSLTVHYADGVSDTGTKRLTTPESLDLPLFARTEELFFAVCRRRVRVRGLRLVCAEGKVAGGQLELFPSRASCSSRQAALQNVLDAVRDRHGSTAVRWGRTMPCADDYWCPVAAEPPPVWDPEQTQHMTLTTRNGKSQ